MTGPETTPPTATADRRVEERRTYRTTAVAVAAGQEFAVRTRDISRSGVCIVAAINPPAGLKFRLRMQLTRQPQGTASFEVEVQVMHSVFARQENGFRIGLRFVQASGDLMRAIGHFMEA